MNQGGRILQDIIIEAKRAKNSKILYTNLFMLVPLCILIIYGVKDHKWACLVWGSFGIILIGVGSIITMNRVVCREPLLKITVEGIEDYSTTGNTIFIAFSDISRIDIVNIYGQRMIAVYPRNMEQFISKLPYIKQKAAKANIRMKLPPISFRVDEARDMTIEDILTLLKKRLYDYNSLYYRESSR